MFEVPKKFDIDFGGVYRSIGRDAITSGIIRKREALDWHGGGFPLFSVSVVLRGTGAYIDASGRREPLCPGKLFFRIPGVSHSNLIDPGSNWLEFYLAFHFMKNTGGGEPHDAFLDYTEAGSPGYLKLKNMPDQDDSWVRSMCRHLFALDSQGPVRDINLSLELLNQCYDFLAFLRTAGDESQIALRALKLLTVILDSRIKGFSDEISDAVKEVIQANIKSNSPLPELLKDIPFSYPSLRRHFQMINGYSIGQYQIQCRMEKAVNMLSSGMSVKETAERLGYKNQFFFSKQFHQQIGFPPSVLKKS